MMQSKLWDERSLKEHLDEFHLDQQQKSETEQDENGDILHSHRYCIEKLTDEEYEFWHELRMKYLSEEDD